MGALEPFDTVWVKRFEREGRVVRLKPAKKLAVVSVGMLEVEVPYDGLALPPRRHAPARRVRPAPPRKEPKAAPAATPENKPPAKPAAADAVDSPAAPPADEQNPADAPSTASPESVDANKPPPADSGGAQAS